MYVFNEKWNISVISEQIRQNWSSKWTVNESAFRSIGYPYLSDSGKSNRICATIWELFQQF